ECCRDPRREQRRAAGVQRARGRSRADGRRDRPTHRGVRSLPADPRRRGRAEDGGALDQEVKTTLRPVAAAFVVFGFYAGAFAVAAIDIERTFGLSDAELGLLLAAGVIAGMAVAAIGGAITDKLGAGTALAGALGCWAVLLTLEAVSPRLALFVPA